MKSDGITQSPDRVCVGFVLLQIVPKEGTTFLLLLDDSLTSNFKLLVIFNTDNIHHWRPSLGCNTDKTS